MLKKKNLVFITFLSRNQQAAQQTTRGLEEKRARGLPVMAPQKTGARMTAGPSPGLGAWRQAGLGSRALCHSQAE